MKELLEDVLVIGESEAGKLQCQPAPIDLIYFCQSLVEEFQIGIGTNHPITFNFQSPTAATQAFYYLDSKLLRYILVNLLSNAVKYSPVQSDVIFSVICRPDRVTFQVQDQGIGIPASDQPHLFSPFQRSLNARKIPGTGLGLSIVKQCVDAHGGTITVDSEEGVGTTVTVTLNG